MIASITSCTNTSNPSVIIAAGLLARNARSKGMRSQPWVKASLAPGSRVVRTYLEDAGLLGPLEELGFGIVGHGCTTCIGNSGPLPAAVSSAISEKHLVVCSVLSGNRNFEGRIQQDVRANYLMSPPLVVAYALAGRIDIDLTSEPLGLGSDGSPVFLRDLWPTNDEIAETVQKHIRAEMYAGNYANVGVDEPSWNAIEAPAGQRFAWDPESTYIKRAPYFAGMVAAEPLCVREIRDARVLAWLGDSVTTDHISPAGNIRAQSPAGQWLTDRGVVKDDFNSYGSRRGHDEVMVRGTFANVRIRNRLAGGAEGGVTTHLPSGELMPIYDAAARYAADGTPLIVLAGKEYGSGSSRDWAAKGPFLQGVRAVIAESYERIHRSNLVGMGILPLQFEPGESADALGLTGTEAYSLLGAESVLASPFAAGRRLTVRAVDSTRRVREFGVVVRIDTPKEADYYRNGGILQYVLRQLLGRSEPTAL